MSGKRIQGRKVLDTEQHVPYFFTFISNKLSNNASALYRSRFNIGITEWRVMSVLASKPNIHANQIAAFLGTDKAAISRSLKRLEELKWIKPSTTQIDRRSRTIQLSAAGLAVHDQIIEIALEREKELLAVLTPEEQRLFVGFLQKIRNAVLDLEY
jgi:DNA-binding MarR family transcriptional regulator